MNITSVTQTIAILPELVRSTVDYALLSRAIMIARLNGTDPDLEASAECDDPTHDHSKSSGPLEVWESGRLALEFLTLIKSRTQHPSDFDRGMDAVIGDIDNPQHAVDVIMALTNMLAVVTDDEAIDRFREFFLEAEASA